jgi:hypothetical protein
MWGLQRGQSRARAIEKAIDQADPGDVITIHGRRCTPDPHLCTCKPRTITVQGKPARAIGFRMRKNRR